MGKKFDRELSDIKDRLVTMAVTAETMFKTVVQALVERDRKLLDRLDDMEKEVDRAQIEIDNDTVRLMAVYGPVAMDLRFLLAIARINTEIERVGDQACNIQHHAELLISEPELKKLVDLPRMAEVAGEMIHKSVRAFRHNSPEMAQEVIASDSTVDALHDQIFRELLTYMMSDARSVARAVALLFISRALERIADYATNIAEEVIFMVEGKDVRHEELQQADLEAGQAETTEKPS